MGTGLAGVVGGHGGVEVVAGCAEEAVGGGVTGKAAVHGDGAGLAGSGGVRVVASIADAAHRGSAGLTVGVGWSAGGAGAC